MAKDVAGRAGAALSPSAIEPMRISGLRSQTYSRRSGGPRLCAENVCRVDDVMDPGIVQHAELINNYRLQYT
jgi:hypothetical protein